MNVILIVSDTFRYDNLGCAGNHVINTPELDSFAEQSVVFDQCHVSSFPTIPHRTDMITGRYSFPHYGWSPLRPELASLAEVLRGAGYVTQLIADTPHLMKHEYNFSRGCHGYYWIRGQEGDISFTRCNYEIPTVMRREKTRVQPLTFGHPLVDLNAWANREWTWEEDAFVAQTCRAASKWLEENYKADKFFLWVDCFDVHEPWAAPEFFVDMYHPGYRGEPMLHPNYGPATAYTKAELKNLWAHYAAETTLVTKWIGYLLRKIEDLGLNENTAICFTADHGMYIGEHNRAGKSNICEEDDRGPWPLYEELTHIPLIIRAPGVKSGQRIRELAQPPDIMPTLLELAGVDGPDGMEGHSLAPLMKGRKVKWPRQHAFCSPALTAGLNDRPKTTVRSKRWALVIGGQEGSRPELYDMRADPQQKRNVFSKNRTAAERMHRALLRFLSDVGTDEAKIASVSEL